MKNLRKIVAILGAALMLISVLPMSAFAAPGDVIVDYNFDDGSNKGFERSINENGYLVFDASTDNWQNTYAYIGGFQTNVDYVVSFKAKADRNTNLNFKINDNWGPDAAKFTVDVTTEWQEFEGIINMASLTSAIVMFSSNTLKADGATYYIDDLKIVEKAEEAPELEVGVVKNGNFENGSEGWVLDSSASIENGALKLENSNQWAEAAMQTIAVEVGTEYTLSWKSQRVSGNGAYMMFILKGDNSNHPAVGQNWMNETSGNWVEQALVFTAEEDTLRIKVSNQDANGVILIDDIKLTATPKVEVGKITNGDFETGDLAGWTKWQSTDVSADAAHTGSYGVNIIGNGGWGGMLDQHINIEDGKAYELSFWFKVNNSGFNWSLKGDQSGTSYGSGWMQTQTWTQVTKTFVANGDTSVFLNFNGGDTGVTESAYIDDVKLVELKDPSDDGFIKNGDFETGKDAPWTLYSGTAVVAEAAKNGNYGLYIKNPTGGWGGTAFQDFSVEIGKSYEVTMWAKNLTGSRGQNIQIQNGGATVASKWFDNTFEWTLLTFEFTATATNCRINICGGGTYANEEIYVDDIKVVELKQASFDGYIYNGDFETGEVFPWDNLWGSCPTVEIVEGGKDSAYALNIVSSQWNHVRQTNIAVQPNTWYKVSGWAKNANNMCLLVKDGGDSDDIINKGISAGDEWVEFSGVFNSGDYTTVIVSLMGGQGADQYGIFDNIVMEITEAPCEHEYEYDCSKVCSLCGKETRPEAEHQYFYACDPVCMICYEETNPDAAHTIVHVEAKEATCQELGNVEYWYCSDCGAAWLDETLTMFTNLRAVITFVDHDRGDTPDCQDAICGTCGETVEGFGCISNAPICKDGECIYCGEAVAATTACEAGEDGLCIYCGEEVKSDVVYGDATGDGKVNNQDVALLQQFLAEVEVENFDETAADANGDGKVNNQDVALLQQFLAEWDVTLGPV